LRLESFIHSFLKLLRPEISENLGFSGRPRWQASGEQTAALSNEPESDKKNQDNRGYEEPRNRDDFDSHFANGRNVVVNVRIAVKESVAIAKDVCASRQVKEEEEGPGDSQSRENCRVDECHHDLLLTELLVYFVLKFLETDISKNLRFLAGCAFHNP
jgi:hypothetical protein